MNERLLSTLKMKKRRKNTPLQDDMDELRKLFKEFHKDLPGYNKAVEDAPNWYIDLLHVYSIARQHPDLIPTTTAAVFKLISDVLSKRMIYGKHDDDYTVVGYWPDRYVHLYGAIWECVNDAESQKVTFIEVAGLLQFMAYKLNDFAESEVKEWGRQELARRQREKLKDKDIN